MEKFVTLAYGVSGNTETMKQDLKDHLHICGRISPQAAWDYIGRMKMNPTKELLVIRFHAATEEEKVHYVQMYSYLLGRNRYGVISGASKVIKDMYIVPLPANAKIPGWMDVFVICYKVVL